MLHPDAERVIELIGGAFPAYRSYQEYEFYEITLFESDFKREGLTIDRGSYILKQYLESKGIVSVSPIHAYQSENDEFGRNGEWCVTFEALPLAIRELVVPPLSRVPAEDSRITFSFNDCTLTIKGIEMPFGSPSNKQNGCYVLEYLFQQKDNGYAASYHDIQEENPIEPDKYDWRVFYRACVSIQNRVGKETGIGDFLVFGAGPGGEVRINPKYLP